MDRLTSPVSPARRTPPRRALRSLASLAAVVLLASGCGEPHHFVVDLNGNAQPADKDGNPLPGQPATAATSNTGGMGSDAASDSATPVTADAGGKGSAHAADATGGSMGSGSLRGTITLQPDLGVNSGAFACVFIMARRDATKAIECVRKIDHPQFPLQFELSGGGHDGQGTALSGNYQIVARLDSDGDAGSLAGDVQGTSGTLVAAGGPPVTIVLNQVLKVDGAAMHPVTGSSAPATAPSGSAPSAPAAPFAPFAGGAAKPPTAAESAAAEAGPHLDGTVELDPAFASLAGHGLLFVFVRSASAEGGMPIAVVPIKSPQFPATFHITSLNVALDVENKADMLAGQLKITARLSLSGNAKAAPDDVESEPLLVKAGDRIALKLTKKHGS